MRFAMDTQARPLHPRQPPRRGEASETAPSGVGTEHGDQRIVRGATQAPPPATARAPYTALPDALRRARVGAARHTGYITPRAARRAPRGAGAEVCAPRGRRAPAPRRDTRLYAFCAARSARAGGMASPPPQRD